MRRERRRTLLSQMSAHFQRTWFTIITRCQCNCWCETVDVVEPHAFHKDAGCSPHTSPSSVPVRENYNMA